MPKKSKPKAALETAPEPQSVTDLAELETLCSEPVTVVVLLKGKPFRFTGRRLIPAEIKHVNLLLEAALPPMAAGKDGEAHYDANDPKFLERLEDNRRAARALALWRAFPVFRQEAVKANHAAVSDELKDVLDFIEHRKLEDDLLQQLFQAVNQRTVDARAYMGFTSGGTSPTS